MGCKWRKEGGRKRVYMQCGYVAEIMGNTSSGALPDKLGVIAAWVIGAYNWSLVQGNYFIIMEIQAIITLALLWPNFPL